MSASKIQALLCGKPPTPASGRAKAGLPRRPGQVTPAQRTSCDAPPALCCVPGRSLAPTTQPCLGCTTAPSRQQHGSTLVQGPAPFTVVWSISASCSTENNCSTVYLTFVQYCTADLLEADRCISLILLFPYDCQARRSTLYFPAVASGLHPARRRQAGLAVSTHAGWQSMH